MQNTEQAGFMRQRSPAWDRLASYYPVMSDSSLTWHVADLSWNLECYRGRLSFTSLINVDLQQPGSQCVEVWEEDNKRGTLKRVVVKNGGRTCVVEGPTARRGTLISKPPLGSFSPRRAGSLWGSRPVSQSHTVFRMAWRTLQWDDNSKTAMSLHALQLLQPHLLVTKAIKYRILLLWQICQRVDADQWFPVQGGGALEFIEVSGTSAGKQIHHHIQNNHISNRNVIMYGYDRSRIL